MLQLGKRPLFGDTGAPALRAGPCDNVSTQLSGEVVKLVHGTHFYCSKGRKYTVCVKTRLFDGQVTIFAEVMQGFYILFEWVGHRMKRCAAEQLYVHCTYNIFLPICLIPMKITGVPMVWSLLLKIKRFSVIHLYYRMCDNVRKKTKSMVGNGPTRITSELHMSRFHYINYTIQALRVAAHFLSLSRQKYAQVTP